VIGIEDTVDVIAVVIVGFSSLVYLGVYVDSAVWIRIEVGSCIQMNIVHRHVCGLVGVGPKVGVVAHLVVGHVVIIGVDVRVIHVIHLIAAIHRMVVVGKIVILVRIRRFP